MRRLSFGLSSLSFGYNAAQIMALLRPPWITEEPSRQLGTDGPRDPQV
jgi:hypothetical protein